VPAEASAALQEQGQPSTSAKERKREACRETKGSLRL